MSAPASTQHTSATLAFGESPARRPVLTRLFRRVRWACALHRVRNLGGGGGRRGGGAGGDPWASLRNQLDQTSPIQLKGVHNVWHSVIKLRQRRRRRRRWRRRAGGEGSSARGRIPAAGGQLCRAHGACCFGNSSSHAAPGGATRGCICRAHILGRVRAPTPNGIGDRVLTHACGERARGWQAHAASCEGDSSSHAAPGGATGGCMSLRRGKYRHPHITTVVPACGHS